MEVVGASKKKGNGLDASHRRSRTLLAASRVSSSS